MTKKKNELEVVEAKDNAVTVVPDFMKQDAGLGIEDMSSKDMEIPRLVILQALSPEVQDGDEKQGTLYHSILEESLGTEIELVPILGDIRYILWRPRHEGGGILARSDDGKTWAVGGDSHFTVRPSKDSPATVVYNTKKDVQTSGLAEWGTSNPEDKDSQPALTKMWNFIFIAPEKPELGPMVVTLQRGAASIGKSLTGKIKMSGLPSFGQRFKLTVKKTDTGNGAFFVPSFVKTGLVSDVDAYNTYKAMYHTFKEMSFAVSVDVDDLPVSVSADEPATDGQIDF